MANKKAKSKKVKISILRLLGLFIFIGLLGRMVYSMFVSNPKTEIVRLGSIELIEETKAFVIKNEKVVQSKTSGRIIKLVDDGTRVKKGVNIVSILKNENINNYQEKVNTIDTQISDIKKGIKEDSIFDGDEKKLEAEISSKMDGILSVADGGEVITLLDIKNDLNQLLDKKAQITGDKGFAANSVAQKEQEKDKYESFVDSSKINVSASDSGIVSFSIDGYEQILSPENIANITPENYEKLNISASQTETSEIEVGQPFVKIIDNFEWYLLCQMKTDKISPLKEGDSVKLFINNEDKSVNAKVYSITKSDESKTSIISFALTSGIDKFYSQRKVDLKIVKRSYQGIKVPKSSLVLKEKINGVYLIEKGEIVFKEVDVVGSNDEFAIIEAKSQLNDKKSLSPFDEIIINPIVAKEGMLIK